MVGGSGRGLGARLGRGRRLLVTLAGRRALGLCSRLLSSRLLGRGAQLSYHDPYVPHLEKGHGCNLEMTSVPVDAASIRKYDAVIIPTDHSTIDYNMVVQEAKCVVDTRNATKAVTKGREKVTKA